MLMNNTYREKILNAILYFAKKVKYPSKVKMFKLLYFLDFIHFKETGQSVTNLDYYAWDYGPVPKDLFEELKSGEVPEDLRDHISIVPYEKSADKAGFEFEAKHTPDLKVFSPREQRIMEELVFVFKDVTPTQISEISHLKNLPWDRTLKTKGKYARIEYELAIDQDAKTTKEDAKEQMEERAEMLANFPLKKRLPS
jgi:uncharacterized phage-associated protein